MSSSITTNNHLPNRRKGSNNNKTSNKQKQQIKKQLPLQWAHIKLSHDITKPRYIGGDNSSLNLILEHKVIYLQEKNNTPKWSIKLKDLDDIQGCGQVLQRIFNSQQHYDDGDEDTTDLDDECDDYDEQINVATEGMTWRDNVWTLRSKDHKRVICCCLGNDDFVKESSSFQMACGARSFRRTFEKVGDGIVRKEEEKEDEIRLRNGHNNSNNNGGIGNDDNYHYHRNNNNNNKNNKRTMTQRKSQALKTPLPKRITTPIRSNNNNSNNNKRVLFKKNNSTTKKKRKNGDILDDVLYFSSDSDNIVAGKEDDDDDEDDTTEKEAKVEEDIVVEDEEKEAQFNDIENGKNDSDDGTIETIINDDDNDDVDNDNDNDNDEDSIEIINNNNNINNNTNIDRSQTLSPPLDLNRIMDQEVHFDEKENKIILTKPSNKQTTVMVPGRKRLRRSYGRSLQNRPQQLHNGEADDEGKNGKENNEKIDESNNDVSSDEELFTSSNATRNRSAVVLDDDDSDDDDQADDVNTHHLSEDNDDDAKKEDTINNNLTIDEIDTKVEVENNDGTKTPPSSQSILNDHPNDNDDDNSDKNNNHGQDGINDDTIHASSTSTSKSNVTTLNKTKAATLVTPGSHNKKLGTDMKVKTTTTSNSNSTSSNNNSNNVGNKKMGSIASFFRKKGKDDALTMTATATTTKAIPAEATTTTTNTTTATTSTSTPTTSPTINKEDDSTTTKTITKKGARRALLNKFAKKGKDDIKKKMPFHSSFKTNVDKIEDNTSSSSSSGSTSPLPLSMLTNNDKVDDDSQKIGDTATTTTPTATTAAATITKTPAWALASSKETKKKKITIKKQMSPSSLPNAMDITATVVTKGAHVEDSKLPPPGNGITLSKSKSTISNSSKSVISSKSASEIPTLSPSRKNKRKAPSSLTFFNNPYEKTILPSSPTRGTTTAATATTTTTSTTNQNNNATTAPRHYHNPYKNNQYNNTKQHKRVIAKNSIGLRNMGNTCYLNSSIQLLLNTSQFILDLKTYRDYLLMNSKDTMKEKQEVTVAEVDKVEVVGNGNGPLLVLPLTDAILSIARSLGFLSTTTVTNANSTVLPSASAVAVPPMVAPAPPSVAASGEASPYFTQSSPEKNIPSMEDEDEVKDEDDDDEVPVLITSVNNNVPPSSPLRAATVSLSSILQSRTTTETSATTTPVSPVAAAAAAAVAPTVVSPITSAIDPSPLKRAIDSITNKFIGYEQRDAHEFFSDLIDLLHDELVLATTGNTAAVVDRISSDMDIDADTDTNPSNANVDTSSQNVSLLSKSSSSSSTKMSVPLLPTDQYFRMNVNVRLTCDKCGYSRSKEEMYRHLSVEVGSDNNILGNGLKKEGLSSSSSSDGPRTIEKGLRQFFCPEKRELRCEKCKTGETATQTMEVKTFPKALLLHLKRFIVNQDQLTTSSTQSDHRPAQATFCKNNARIAFKENLSSGLFNSSSTVADKDLLHREYKLRGIVHHIGGTALSGHYTTDVLRQRPSSSVGGVENWVTFDDAHATEISSAEVLGDEGSQRNSYMILYGL